MTARQQLISDAAKLVRDGVNLGDALVNAGERIASQSTWHTTQIDTILIFADNEELSVLFGLVLDKASGQ
jgi:hypothetical protein